MSEPDNPPPLPAPVQTVTPVPIPKKESSQPDDRPPWLRLLHPWSAALLLTVDTLCFGPEALSGMMAEPLIMVSAFGVTFTGVFKIQRTRAGEGKLSSFVKAFICGILAGLPFPIAGTAVGGLVLLAAGMSAGSGGKKPPAGTK